MLAETRRLQREKEVNDELKTYRLRREEEIKKSNSQYIDYDLLKKFTDEKGKPILIEHQKLL